MADYQYDPNKASTTYQQAQYGGGKDPSQFDVGYANYLQNPGGVTSNYAGFSQFNPNKTSDTPANPWQVEHDAQNNKDLSGTWTSGQGGPQITNLPGYLGMKEQQQAGSDFSLYGSRLKDLMSDPNKIADTNAYKFMMGQGTQAINRSAAAKGQLGGGGVLAELAKYGQGLASQEYGNEINRLSSLMGNAQQFGLSSGYYNPEQYTASLGIKAGGGSGYARPTPQKPAAAINYNAPMGYVATA